MPREKEGSLLLRFEAEEAPKRSIVSSSRTYTPRVHAWRIEPRLKSSRRQGRKLVSSINFRSGGLAFIFFSWRGEGGALSSSDSTTFYFPSLSGLRVGGGLQGFLGRL